MEAAPIFHPTTWKYGMTPRKKNGNIEYVEKILSMKSRDHALSWATDRLSQMGNDLLSMGRKRASYASYNFKRKIINILRNSDETNWRQNIQVFLRKIHYDA